ncbi:RNA-binding S4 domain-containing protein [Marimonas arenosa]|uniref:RNA-binding S4 domain-containing protein n=1 Tax=Marimonas arenosa TaxID=1795305 RepID=A0AAE3WEG3_9RHOB|nr:RNA-binding S4 domain-containing protein [Marimonas arenosa]MDQ2091094.1 RNA-binding S4 domain-containing protein [Marimonas arenosa]
MAEASGKIRLDKWLWYARFFKTRGLAAKVVSGGHVRVNGAKVAKPAQSVAPGDVLTFPQARVIRVVRILSAGTRRGPANEAQALYEDLTPTPGPGANSSRPRGGGERPTKRDRRAMEALKKGEPGM